MKLSRKLIIEVPLKGFFKRLIDSCVRFKIYDICDDKLLNPWEVYLHSEEVLVKDRIVCKQFISPDSLCN